MADKSKCLTCGCVWQTGQDGSHSCAEHLQKKLDERMKSWGFKRPYCNPSSGNVLAYSADEAIKLVHFMHGFTSNTEVYCAETNERKKDLT